jgi:hypothetical protein
LARHVGMLQQPATLSIQRTANGTDRKTPWAGREARKHRGGCPPGCCRLNGFAERSVTGLSEARRLFATLLVQNRASCCWTV